MPWGDDIFAGQDVAGTPLVGPDDFAEWFSIPSPTNDELNRIATAVEIASASIRNSRRLFTAVSGDVVQVDTYGGTSLLLPRNRLPVTSVALVEELSGADYVTVDSSEYDWSSDGYVTRSWSSWSCRPKGARVTYSHGYDSTPRDVAGVCLAVAKRLYDQPDGGGGVQSEQLGDHHVTYFANTGVILPNEEEILRAYEARA